MCLVRSMASTADHSPHRDWESYRPTHELVDIFRRAGALIVDFNDGDQCAVSECSPIDYSIYHLRGGWSGTVIEYFEPSEKKKRLFPPDTGIDLYEEDIVRVTDKNTGEVLWQKT
jgi:hypothetical protein